MGLPRNVTVVGNYLMGSNTALKMSINCWAVCHSILLEPKSGIVNVMMA